MGFGRFGLIPRHHEIRFRFFFLIFIDLSFGLSLLAKETRKQEEHRFDQRTHERKQAEAHKALSHQWREKEKEVHKSRTRGGSKKKKEREKQTNKHKKYKSLQTITQRRDMKFVNKEKNINLQNRMHKKRDNKKAKQGKEKQKNRPPPPRGNGRSNPFRRSRPFEARSFNFPEPHSPVERPHLEGRACSGDTSSDIRTHLFQAAVPTRTSRCGGRGRRFRGPMGTVFRCFRFFKGFRGFPLSRPLQFVFWWWPAENSTHEGLKDTLCIYRVSGTECKQRSIGMDTPRAAGGVRTNTYIRDFQSQALYSVCSHSQHSNNKK